MDTTSTFVPDADYIAEMSRAHLNTLLWANADDPVANEDGDLLALDDRFDLNDFDDDSARRSLEEVTAFCEGYGHLLGGWSSTEAGHDFALTRNGHGAGFWDRGREAGEALSDGARPYGSTYVFVTKDGEHIAYE